jgi:hypothetical protein
MIYLSNNPQIIYLIHENDDKNKYKNIIYRDRLFFLFIL